MEYGFTDILQLLGSLGLFLFGMTVMSDALMKLAGNRMRKILASMTSNRFLGVITGFLITSIIQSSSATTLMVVSFTNASLLTLTESISVIMGANIGTTITAWLITILGFKVSMSAIALPLVGLGFGFTFSKKEQQKNWGMFIIGFAVLFIGLQFLKDAVPDVKNNPDILAFLTRYTDLGFLSVLLFLFIGTLLTVIIQSSSATMALTLIMTAQGWIPFELAAAMVLGENIGTTITANLAALVANFNAKRTARAHLIFNIIGVIWVLIVFYPFLKLIDWMVLQTGSESPYLNAAAIPVAISLFHTFFNVLNTFLLIWFVKPIAKIVKRVVKERVVQAKEIDEPKYLSEKVMKYPETLIISLINESKYLYKNAIFEIVAHGLNLHREDIKSDLKVK
jgi:phosphate:Na+ symporter